jgi:hypothetical protein
MLMKFNCAAVEANSSALGANRDTRRRRSFAGLDELQSGVTRPARSRKVRKADARLNQPSQLAAATRLLLAHKRSYRLPEWTLRLR